MFRHIVHCCDFSVHAEKALDAAAAQARLDQARLTLLHVIAPGLPLIPGESPLEVRGKSDADVARRLDEYLRQRYAARLEGLDWKPALRRGHPSEEILAHLAASDADLVVMGCQGLSGMGLVVLGSVAERVSRRAPCSCLVIR